jgi:transposase-like protein
MRHRRVLRNDSPVGQEIRIDYARRLRRKPPSPNDVWHVDEVIISIADRERGLWSAIAQDGYVLDEIVQSRHNTKAAKRQLTQQMKKQGMPLRRIVTDKLSSYGAARRHVMRRAAVYYPGHRAVPPALRAFLDVVREVRHENSD